jgi:hypothetical protein
MARQPGFFDADDQRGAPASPHAKPRANVGGSVEGCGCELAVRPFYKVFAEPAIDALRRCFGMPLKVSCPNPMFKWHRQVGREAAWQHNCTPLYRRLK